ncbi:MAG: hypothetical protein LBO66_10650 [Deltaproteobacteria bacterium]|jgi:hypothetical protein|nr:hypothetical protein [Deltaproteobacteria bacterium]
MRATGKIPVLLGLALAFWTLAPVLAAAQMAPLRPLELEEVRADLEGRIRRGGSYQTIWNAGYDFYRIHQRNQDTAMTIFRAYSALRGDTPEQDLALKQAAIYWLKVHDYGITNVPVGVDNSYRENAPSPRRGRRGNLRMLRPKGGPVPLRESEASMANRSRPRENARGRVTVRYPGPYYSGVYPP